MQFEQDYFERELQLVELRAFPVDEYILEAEGSGVKFIGALVEFFRNVRLKLKDLITGNRTELTKKFKNEKVKQSLRKMYGEVGKAMKKGAPYIEFYDVWKYQATVDKAVSEINRWMKGFATKYKFVGCGMKETDMFCNKMEKIVDKYETELAALRKNKIKVPPEKLYKWIESQLIKGNLEIFSFADEYLKTLEECEKMVNEFKDKADKYAEENGYIRKPTKITQSLRNATTFVKKNADWITAICAGTALRYIGVIGRTKLENKAYASGEIPRGDSMIASDAHMVNRAKQKVEEELVDPKDKKKVKVVKVADATALGVLGYGVTSGLNAVMSKKNSV